MAAIFVTRKNKIELCNSAFYRFSSIPSLFKLILQQSDTLTERSCGYQTVQVVCTCSLYAEIGGRTKLFHVGHAVTSFLGVSAKFRKATNSFVVFLCLSICTHGANRLSCGGFSWKFISEYFSKIYPENSSIKIWQQYFTWRPKYVSDHISLSSPYNEKCFWRTVYTNSKHILCSATFFSPKLYLLRNNVGNFCRAR